MARAKKLAGQNTFAINADMSMLNALIEELQGSVKNAIRPAAQAAAQVVYDRVKVNVSGIGKVSGNLDSAIYQAFSKENSKKGERAEYHVSWNHKKAPHGHLLEWGWLQRYRYRPDGMGPMVRAGMEGKPKPGRHASQAEKDAYYVTLPTPKQIPGRAFIRSAEAVLPQAALAAEDELIKRVLAKG